MHRNLEMFSLREAPAGEACLVPIGMILYGATDDVLRPNQSSTTILAIEHYDPHKGYVQTTRMAALLGTRATSFHFFYGAQLKNNGDCTLKEKLR